MASRIRRLTLDKDLKYAIGFALALFIFSTFWVPWPLALTLGSLLLFLEVVSKAPFTRRDRILAAFSKDGLNWTTEGVCIDCHMFSRDDMAYHPFVVPMGKGYRMYYRGSREGDCIVSAFSKDGFRFRPEEGVRLRGSAPHPRARFPFVVKIKNGWRMYYSSSYDGMNYDICSAFSKDGLEWILEPGVRIRHGDRFDSVSASASFVVPASNGYRMYYNGLDGEEYYILTAFSKDGLVWKKEGLCLRPGGLNYRMSVSNPCIVEGKIMRMYYAGDNCVGVNLHNTLSGKSRQVILSAVSKDGRRWKREQGIRITTDNSYATDGLLSPNVIKIPSGYRMYYTAYWGSYLLEPLVKFLY